jgi:hypothetical protein
MIAAVIPVLVNSNMPVNIPITPWRDASDMAPLTRALPKLEMGRLAPAPAN